MKRVAAVFVLFVLSVAFATNYQNSLQLDNDYEIAWNIVDDSIHLKLVVNTTGWIGFGIAEQTSGSMPGADIVTATVSGKDVNIYDRYATAKAEPAEDSCSHWTVVSGTEADGKTTIELSRLLDTNDTQDRPFTVGLMKIIYAFGETDVFGYHGNNRFFTSVTFIPNPNQQPGNETGWQSLDLIATYNVPTDTTTYSCTTYNLVFPSDVHIVQFEMLLNETNFLYVHHMVLYRCSTNNTDWYAHRLQNTETCTPLEGETDGSCHEAVWGWAHGSLTYSLPEDIGFRAGPSKDAIHWIEVQIHYNNPSQVAGIIDNSGVRIHYTTQLRKYDAGVVTLGDPLTTGTAIPPGQAAYEYEYSCSTACTTNLPHNLYVFGSTIHMHQLGIRGWTRQWRGDEDLGYTTRIEYYDFGFQEFMPTNFTIVPGDRLQTHCVYDTTGQSDYTPFGTPSNWEMCMNFIMYYPRVTNFDFCGYGNMNNKVGTLCGTQQITEKNPTSLDPYGGIVPAFGVQNCEAQQSGGDSSSTSGDNNQTNDMSSAVAVTISLLVPIAFVLAFM